MTDRAALIAALRDVFRARGWDGASLADLAAATGLNRATLYHHFPQGKAEMAAAALNDVETLLERDLLAPLLKDGTPAAKLRRMSEAIDGYYRQGELGCLLGALASRAADHGLGGRVSAAFEAWVEALAGLAAEALGDATRARANALMVVVAIQGALVVATATKSPEPFRMVLARLPELLFAPAPSPDDQSPTGSEAGASL